MTDERYEKLQNNSIYGHTKVPLTSTEYVTFKEWEEGYHYCLDWDGLFIGPENKEFECCTCHPLTYPDKQGGKDGFLQVSKDTTSKSRLRDHRKN